MAYPKRSLQDWTRIAADIIDGYFYVPPSELARMHEQLHAEYGENPDLAVIETEQLLSFKLRGRGLEHRYNDNLAKKAGTVVVDPRPVTVWEVTQYIESMMLDSRAVEFVQDVDGGPIYLLVNSPLLKGSESKILKAINRCLPPGAVVKALSKNASGSFAKVEGLYSLSLERLEYPEPRTTTWDAIVVRLKSAAAEASLVFKDGIKIPFNVVKALVDPRPMDEGIVTGVVLMKDKLDRTKWNPDGTPILLDGKQSAGDVYSREAVTKAMYFWMENANQSFTYYHTVKGGMRLTSEDVVLLECWQTRQEEKHGEDTIPEGTWMMTAKVKNEVLKEDIANRKIQSWSIEADCLGGAEEVEVDEDGNVTADA